MLTLEPVASFADVRHAKCLQPASAVVRLRRSKALFQRRRDKLGRDHQPVLALRQQLEQRLHTSATR